MRNVWVAAVFGIVAFCLLSFSAVSIHVTWDEPIGSAVSERAATWLGLVIQGKFAAALDPYTFGISWGLGNEHPPLVRIVNGLGWALTHPFFPPPFSHRFGNILLAALFFSVLVYSVASIRGLRSGLFAAVALLTMPRTFFHAHLGVIDFPLAALWMMGSLFFWQRMLALDKPTTSLGVGRSLHAAFVAGSWLGLALLTKINAVLLVPFWGLWLLCYRRRWQHLTAFALAIPTGLLVLWAGWPWIWRNPIQGLWNWVQFFRVHFDIGQWFAGQRYIETPWFAPFVIVLITTPAILLLLAGLGAVTEQQGKFSWRIDSWRGLHLLGIATILGYFASPWGSIHDQDRLLLPAAVHLAVLAGDGFSALWHWVQQRWELSSSSAGSIGAQLLLASLLLFPGVRSTVQLHPFQLAYYNELIGGMAGAQRRGMETIYFASTYGHFLPELRRLPAGSKLWVMPNSWGVIYYYQVNGLLPKDLVLLRPPGWGSFYDDQGVRYAEGTLVDADFALIERRQTAFNDATPENATQLAWAATQPEIARLTRNDVILATLHARSASLGR